MRLWGHGYWTVIAVRVWRPIVDGEELLQTQIMQRCMDCGKIRVVKFAGDWEDYSDGIYDDISEAVRKGDA